MEIINFFNPISKSRWSNPKLKHFVCIGLCFIAVMTYLSIIFLGKFSLYVISNQEKSNLQTQFDMQKNVIQKLAYLEKHYASTAETIIKLKDNQAHFSKILVYISKIIPTQVRLIECSIDKEFSLTGYAKKLSKLYTFIQNLANHPAIEKINLYKTTQETTAGDDLIKFFCTIVPAKNSFLPGQSN